MRLYPAKRIRQNSGFQSTHPLRGATHGKFGALLFGIDFNPRTPCGVRRCGEVKYNEAVRNFNPRTPCGVRPARFGDYTEERMISIHAPLAGCDCIWSPLLVFVSVFQSTHPLRGATKRLPKTGLLDEFQSTHPLRGATIGSSSAAVNVYISIHAHLTGCDLESNARYLAVLNFNPRTPHGVRQP